MTRILVTGATGTIGREVVAQLGEAGVGVRAMTRNPAARNPVACHPELARDPAAPAAAPAVEVVRGDLEMPETLDAALDGCDAVFLVWTAAPGAAAGAVERIAARGVRVMYLTAPHQTPHPFFQQPNRVADMHRANEQLIDDAGLRRTFLRPGMFMANTLAWWGAQIRAGDVVRWPYADVPTAPIDERDVAAVAVLALLDPRHDGMEHVITGPESLTHREQVETIGEVLGRPIRLEEISPDTARTEWGWPLPVANMLLNAWAAAAGVPAFMTTAVSDLLGRPARTFREWVSDRAAAW